MIRSGDWIIPHYNGQPWFEKPILFYWLAAPCVWLFGEEVGPRLPSVLAAMGLYVMVGLFVARRLGAPSGRGAMIVLGTAPLMAALGRLMLVDAVFVLCLSASFLALWKSFSHGPGWRLGSGALLGLAVLAKGPVAVVLWVFVLALTAWRQREVRRAVLDPMANASALAAMLAVVAIWYLPAYQRGGQAFVDDFLIKQNLGRFTGGDEAHRVPWYLHLPYYVLVIALGMLPWTVRVIRGWPRRAESGEAWSSLLQFCGHWAIAVVVLFTLSGSKLPHYVLPAFVPLAVLAARTFQAPLFGLGTLLWGIALSVILNVALLVHYQRSGQAEAHALIAWIRSEGGAVATYQLPRRQDDKGTGRLKLQETSLPSLSFYLDQVLRHADTPGELSELVEDTWVFTRRGRIGQSEQAELGKSGKLLERAKPPVGDTHFYVFRIRGSEGQRIKGSSD